MAANCLQLRQSLTHLQNQLNVLTNKGEPSSPDAAKPEKKKTKSKKNKPDKHLEKLQEDEAKRPEEKSEPDDKTAESEAKADDKPKESESKSYDKPAEKTSIPDDEVAERESKPDDKTAERESKPDDKSKDREAKPVEHGADASVERLSQAVNQANLGLSVEETSKNIPNGEGLENGHVIHENGAADPNEHTTVATNGVAANIVVGLVKDDLNDSSFVEPGVNDEVSQILEEKSLLDINEEVKS